MTEHQKERCKATDASRFRCALPKGHGGDHLRWRTPDSEQPVRWANLSATPRDLDEEPEQFYCNKCGFVGSEGERWGNGLKHDGCSYLAAPFKSRPDEEPEWPVVVLSRRDGRTSPDNYEIWIPGSGPDEGFLQQETYYPASAPNVLSPEEARLVYISPTLLNDREMRQRGKVLDRLLDLVHAAKGTQP